MSKGRKQTSKGKKRGKQDLTAQVLRLVSLVKLILEALELALKISGRNH